MSFKGTPSRSKRERSLASCGGISKARRSSVIIEITHHVAGHRIPVFRESRVALNTPIQEIRQIPKLPTGNVIIDGNKLLEQLGVTRYALEQQRQLDTAGNQ